MILLFNVYLDAKSTSYHAVDGNASAVISQSPKSTYFRGLYPQYSNVDIFKYTLASTPKIYPWSKVIINVALHPDLQSEKDGLFSYICELFKDFNLILNNTRCERQNDWKQLYDSLDDNLIFFCCNHDHVFIDHDPAYFQDTVKEFRENFENEYASLYFSHWPDVHTAFLNERPWGGGGFTSSGECHLMKTFAYTMADCYDSLQIITKSLYYNWWFSGDFNHKFLPRTDFFGDSIPTAFSKIQAVPYREYFKHFDGYTHTYTGDVHRQSIAANVSPPLFIPPGFFENKIKLKVGYDKNDPDCININLSKKNYTVVDSDGTDMKCYLDEIPFFWKDKISIVDKNELYNELEYSIERDDSIISPLTSELFQGSFSNKSVLDNIKTCYSFK